jgi:DNA-binding GntR family transcriptional regulator
MSLQVDLLSRPGGPPGHQSLSRTVADWLAQRIISGEIAPGERLTEPRLAELAGVSRSPVREALRILATEGLVDITPRHGAHVARLGASDARVVRMPTAVGAALHV